MTFWSQDLFPYYFIENGVNIISWRVLKFVISFSNVVSRVLSLFILSVKPYFGKIFLLGRHRKMMFIMRECDPKKIGDFYIKLFEVVRFACD